MEISFRNERITVADREHDREYQFDIRRLYELWLPGKDSRYEWIGIDTDGEYLYVLMTTASDQGGIVAVIDLEHDRIVHYHDGAYAINCVRWEDKLITLYGVSSWGTPYHNVLDVIDFGTKDAKATGTSLPMDQDHKFTRDSDLTFELRDGCVIVSDEKGDREIASLGDCG